MMLTLLYLAVFAGLMGCFIHLQRSGWALSKTVLMALVAGTLFGALLQAIHGAGSDLVASTIAWIDVVGGGYVRLLKMIVMPLVLITILSAVTRMGDAAALGKISLVVLGVLLLTTAIAAIVGISMTQLFGLTAEGLVQGARELERADEIVAKREAMGDLSVPDLLLSFISTNIFADLSGDRDTSIIAVVIFAALLGFAALMIRRETPEMGQRIMDGIESMQALILKLVRIVIRLTPYGVLALMTKVVATSDINDILNLIGFVVASYLGLALILLVHSGVLMASKTNPLQYFKKVWPVLTFAFTSRSSAATIPLNIETQVNKLGNSQAIANFSASFGATIGQNGCAGLYPAMLAMMIAPTVGIDATSLSFIATLVLVVVFASFGIAGVGGGATFAAIIVLSTLDLPIALAGLLISIEPLIDMGRTAINVNGAMTAGTAASRWLGMRAPEPVAEQPSVSEAQESTAV